MNPARQAGLGGGSASIGQILLEAEACLKEVTDSSPALEVGVLLGHVLGKPRTYLLAWPERELMPSVVRDFRELLRRRTGGEPLAYILGYREFWSLRLEVTTDTLIPRPETERLVELVLDRLPPGREFRVADLGTGCGAVAAAIASERPDARVTATDISAAALEVAEVNFRNLSLPDVRTRLGNWFGALRGEPPFDILCSNPPYVAHADPYLMSGDLPHEPRRALVSGSQGLDDIRGIARDAPGFLNAGGWLLLEHGETQGQSVREILRREGLSEVATFSDLAGRDRVTVGRKP